MESLDKTSFQPVYQQYFHVQQLNDLSQSLYRKELLFIWWNYVTAVLDVDILRPKIDMHV